VRVRLARRIGQRAEHGQDPAAQPGQGRAGPLGLGRGVQGLLAGVTQAGHGGVRRGAVPVLRQRPGVPRDALGECLERAGRRGVGSAGLGHGAGVKAAQDLHDFPGTHEALAMVCRVATSACS